VSVERTGGRGAGNQAATQIDSLDIQTQSRSSTSLIDHRILNERGNYITHCQATGRLHLTIYTPAIIEQIPCRQY
jgi:hypothetical protein